MNPELGRRVVFTLGALLVYRIGTHIPLPGIDATVWSGLFRDQGGGILGMLNVSSGGAVARLAVFALGITPYVSAAILLQFASLVFGRLRALRSAGEAGRRRLDWYVRALALLLALAQGFGIARALQGVTGLVPDPGPLFVASVALTLAGGAMFVMWLADQITLRGIGNGVALLLCVGVIVELPQALAGALELGRQGVLPGHVLAGIALLAVVLVAAASFMEMARREERVEFGANTAHLSFKLNGAGIIPAIVAAWVVAIVAALVGLLSQESPAWLASGSVAFMLATAVVIFFCVFLYTAFVLDPSEAAENLRKYGGVIPQVEPGEATAEHLDRVLSRVTLIGAVYFVAVCLIPELLISWAQVPFYLGGTSLLVLVCTVLDVEAQTRKLAHIMGG
jgi:preprotein translocase subunit SecY